MHTDNVTMKTKEEEYGSVWAVAEQYNRKENRQTVTENSELKLGEAAKPTCHGSGDRRRGMTKQQREDEEEANEENLAEPGSLPVTEKQPA